MNPRHYVVDVNVNFPFPLVLKLKIETDSAAVREQIQRLDSSGKALATAVENQKPEEQKQK